MTTIRPAHTLEELAGRLLALCCHPVAAWRVVSPGERGLIVSVYISASYIGVLAGLLCCR